MTLPAPVPPGDSVDACPPAEQRARAVTIVLARLFQKLAYTGGAPVTGATPHDDPALWASVAQLLGEIAAVHGGSSATSEDQTENGATLIAELALEPGDPDLNGHPPATRAAASLARAALDVDLSHIIDDNEDGWNELLAAVRQARFPPRGGNDGSTDPSDLYSRLAQQLPADLRRDFRRYAESRALEEIVERYAAFELGRQVERQAIQKGRR